MCPHWQEAYNCSKWSCVITSWSNAGRMSNNPDNYLAESQRRFGGSWNYFKIIPIVNKCSHQHPIHIIPADIQHSPLLYCWQHANTECIESPRANICTHLARISSQHVNHPPRRADDDLGAALQLCDLLRDAGTTCTVWPWKIRATDKQQRVTYELTSLKTDDDKTNRKHRQLLPLPQLW